MSLEHGVLCARTQSPAATPFLVRMLAFSHANQEKLACLSHEAMIALRSTDSEIQTQGFRVLTALVADRVIPGLEDQMFEVLSPSTKHPSFDLSQHQASLPGSPSTPPWMSVEGGRGRSKEGRRRGRWRVANPSNQPESLASPRSYVITSKRQMAN
jgi:hypothetical protein